MHSITRYNRRTTRTSVFEMTNRFFFFAPPDRLNYTLTSTRRRIGQGLTLTRPFIFGHCKMH